MGTGILSLSGTVPLAGTRFATNRGSAVDIQYFSVQYLCLDVLNPLGDVLRGGEAYL